MRRKPYTALGIKRKRCFRCGARAHHQWQICSDGRQFRPICVECDIALNRTVLEFMRFPPEQVEAMMRDYEPKARL